MATELIESKVDVIVAVTANGAKEIKQAKSAIPTVFVIVADPVGSGFVESLAHPGDNMTGLSLMSADMSGKRLALLKETVSNLSRVALLFDPTSRNLPLYISLYANAAKALGLFLQPVEVPTPDTIEDVFSAIARDGFDGAEVDGSMMFNDFQLPTFPAMPSSRPISISVSLESPRQMTVFPGGGSLDRAR